MANRQKIRFYLADDIIKWLADVASDQIAADGFDCREAREKAYRIAEEMGCLTRGKDNYLTASRETFDWIMSELEWAYSEWIQTVKSQRKEN